MRNARKDGRKSSPANGRPTGSYLAESFLDFYGSRGHEICRSAPLIPEDPTLLFTAAGMVPFKSYYSDPDKAPYRRAASVQKCLRAGGKQSDLENVGRTLRHHTFFEMLGNFSFGDYFKQEAIDTAWELSVDVWGIDRDRIWISVYEDDDEAHDLWLQRIGIPEDRIVRLGKKDNFWGPVGDTGVCGPSSELYYDTGAARSCGRGTCRPGCDCDRFIEYWNLVFPQFFFTEKGTYDRLPRPGIDTGMGLERVAFVLQEVEDNFHTDLFLPIRTAVSKALPGGEKSDRERLAVNAGADHIRALVFALAEGIRPANEGRGYVLRRLLRRAVTKMYPLGVKDPFLSEAVNAVVDTMGGRYPELQQPAAFIKKTIRAEEENFLATIEQGWNKLLEVIESGRKSRSREIPGREVFTLYDTFGFPMELTVELAEDEGLTVDEPGFHSAMEEQRERSRRHHQMSSSSGVDAGMTSNDALGPFVMVDDAPGDTEFLGYGSLVTEAKIMAFRHGGGNKLQLVTDRTVFYAESGGQVGDSGYAQISTRRFPVIDAFWDHGRIVHVVEWEEERVPDEELETLFESERHVRLEVDRETRLATKRNHTATHLLHASLRTVLGEHVAQAGSLVAPDRLRFDFHHFQPMTDAEVTEVEKLVNMAVLEDMEVHWRTLPYKEAVAQGAMALFGEKYPENVRMVTIDDFSKELCGGTHLDRTGEIGLFHIRQEAAVAAGVRRVEALTGSGALRYFRELLEERSRLAHMLKVGVDDVVRRVESLAAEHDTLKKKVAASARERTSDSLSEAVRGAEMIGDVQLVSFTTGEGDLNSLRRGGDFVRSKMDLGVGLLLLAQEKPILLVTVSERLTAEKGLKANDLARRIGDEFSLRGGGRPHMAQLGMGETREFEKIVSYVRDLLKNLRNQNSNDEMRR